jgi:histidine triad (HIT) family protein
MKCIFCKVAHEGKENAIYENSAAVAVLDIHPLAPGHAIVLPKAHAETLLDLPDQEINPVFQAVKKTTKLLKKALAPDGFTIGINHGSVAGQAIDHLHIHIIPRFKGDGGGSIHTIVKNTGRESLESIKAKINAIRSKT